MSFSSRPSVRPSDDDEAFIRQLRENPAVREALLDAENDRIARQYGERGQR